MIKFDPDKNAVIDPASFAIDNMPSKALMIYDDHYFEKLAGESKLVEVIDPTGSKRDDFYILDGEYLVINPGEGSPTSAIMLEMAIASGVKSVVAFGTAGSLDGTTLPHSLIIPTAAIREEGVSYHYIPDSEEVVQDQESINLLKDIVQKNGLDYMVGKTWTTDAFFRETAGKIKKMKSLGCICVDMECSALIAVCRFRNIKFAQFMLSFDNLEADHKHRDIYGNLLDNAIFKVAFGTLDALGSGRDRASHRV